MDLEDLIEIFTMDVVNEGIGTVAGIALLMGAIFGGGLTAILIALVGSVC